MDWLYWATLAVVAPLVGFIGMFSGGFWGVGCGWLIVPTMLVFGFTPMEAVGVGLLQMVPSIVGTVAKEAPGIGWGRGSFGRNLVVPMALGALATAFCGRPINVFFHRHFGSTAISAAFGVFMLTILFQTLFGKTRKYGDETPLVFSGKSRFWAFAAGLGAGVFSSVLGVGGAMVFRPALASGFKASEKDVARAVRFLLLTTTLTGGVAYLFSDDGFDWTILLLSALIALGGAVGFPLGAKCHRIVLDAGYVERTQRSFAIICGIVVVNVALTLAGRPEWSRVAMMVAAVGLLVYLLLFVRRAQKRPLAQLDKKFAREE